MQMLIKNILKLKYKLIAFVYTIWLSFVSLMPLNGMHLPSIVNADKAVHFFLYFFLTIFWLLAFPNFRQHKTRLIILVISWGIMIEFLQEYVASSRTGDPFDALANSLGGLVGLWTYFKIVKK